MNPDRKGDASAQTVSGVACNEELWNKIYDSGEPRCLWSVDEMARYAVIAGYIRFYSQDISKVLDIGCGEGILYQYLDWLPSNAYIGVDLSSSAIASARRLHPAPTFVWKDMDDFAKSYAASAHVVVLNEVLYYAADPIATLIRYSDLLVPSGAMIVSMYKDNDSSEMRDLVTAIWTSIEAEGWRPIGGTVVQNLGNSQCWTIKVLRRNMPSRP